jgi:hypothetical protein
MPRGVHPDSHPSRLHTAGFLLPFFHHQILMKIASKKYLKPARDGL